MHITLVIPTYNEAENIKKLIPVLSSKFKTMPNHRFSVLIVDANSPDGTASIAHDLKEEYPFVHVLVEEEKRGLGAAYLQGFKYAIVALKADVLIEMDADFQHDPNDVDRLIAPIEAGYDYVIGSRFVKGGSIPKQWQFYRKLLSIGGNIFSKLVLGIFSVNDFTSGFKASRVAGFVDRMDLDATLSKGFAYKIDLLFRMHLLGAKIKEIPIEFGLRDRGISKMENNNFLDSMRVVLRLRYNASKSFFRFLTVGLTGLIIDTALFNTLNIVILPSYASLAAGLVAMLTTYMLNNFWSFSHTRYTNPANLLKNFLFYCAFSYVPILFRSYLVRLSLENFGNNFVPNNVAFFLGVLFGVVWNYTVYSRVIWNRSK